MIIIGPLVSGGVFALLNDVYIRIQISDLRKFFTEFTVTVPADYLHIYAPFFKCLLRISITKNQGRIHPAMDRLNRLAESFVREEKANRECRIMTNHVVFFLIVGFLIRSTEIR